MKRRTILKSILAAGALGGFRLPLAQAADHRGKLFVFVQADGGWDPTSFCDPKTNVAGEPAINQWASRDEVRQAGNIPYAPFANNAAFFEKYHRRMLVINGVDAQTNSHTVGVVHNWSGRNSEGYPTATALLAAHYAPRLSIPYLSFGGYSETAGIARFTRLNNPELLRNIATPEVASWNPAVRFFDDADWAAIQAAQAGTADRLMLAPDLMPADIGHRQIYQSAFDGTAGLREYAATIPPKDQLEQPQRYSGANREYYSDLRRQAQLAVLAFKTGVAVSADLWLGGFDTHAYHDQDQGWLLGNLTGAVDFLWDYAEIHGVADRLVVVMGSDFGRTNRYNAKQGKDHWPIGSYVVMEMNQPWTDRVIGETDALHFAQRINPSSLRRDDVDGTIIYPKHVHRALRRYLGIEHTQAALKFPFHDTEDFAFFG
ncbi:MAG: DUF1501 domain-containing protein [Gammaproteobacteria bacterium]|nr:DUF1501 domain-containing protein [Gammaproteobacteria bacterium]